MADAVLDSQDAYKCLSGLGDRLDMVLSTYKNKVKSNKRKAFMRKVTALLEKVKRVDCRGQRFATIHYKFSLIYVSRSVQEYLNYTSYFSDIETTEMVYVDFGLDFEESRLEFSVKEQLPFFKNAFVTMRFHEGDFLNKRLFPALLTHCSQNVVRSREEDPFQIIYNMFDKRWLSFLAVLKKVDLPKDGPLFEEKEELRRDVTEQRIKEKKAHDWMKKQKLCAPLPPQ